MSIWYSWLYHYGVGGAMAAASLIFFLRCGALKLSRPGDRRLVWALAGGLVAFAAAHALWIGLVLAGEGSP